MRFPVCLCQSLRFCALFLSFFLTLPYSAHALPTGNPLPGISGLGVIPTTDSIASGKSEASLIYERLKLDDADGEVDLLPVANLNFGFGRGEAGATFVREKSDIQGFSARNSYYALHGKARVFEGQNLKLALGAHYYDFGDDDGADLGSVLSGYATASYDLNPQDARGARAHGGFLLQRARGGGDNETISRPFLGLEYGFTPALSLAADYLASDGDATRAYTLSLRYIPQKSPLSAQIGVGKLDSDTKFFVGVSYGFATSGLSKTTPGSAPMQYQGAGR